MNMKRYHNIFLWAVMCMFMCVLPSCENEINDEIDEVPIGGDWSDMTGDGSLINGIVLEDSKAPMFSTDSDTKETYVSDGYKDLKFRLKFTWIDIGTYLDEVVPRESLEGVVRKIMKYENEKEAFIYDDFYQYKATHPEIQVMNIISFLFAYIDGEPTITCDKTLFGLEPGTNLSSHFQVCNVSWPRSIPFGIEEPDLLYKCGDGLPVAMDKFFADKSWVRKFNCIELIDIPAEEYEELTFHVSFPMILEHTVEYAIDQYYGRRPERKFTKKTFESDCRVVFSRE